MPRFLIEDAYEGGYDLGPLRRAEVREGFGNHQIAVLDYFVPRTAATKIPPALTPLTLSWGISPSGVRDFYGYVNHHEVVDSTIKGESLFRVYAIGTSQSLNGPAPRSWKNVTASYVARTVAEKHGLRAVVHNSKVVLDYVTPGQGSDFALLQKLANEAGFRFWVDGATVFFLDPRVLVTSPDRSVATAYYYDAAVGDSLVRIRTVDGSLAPTPGSPAIQRVYGLNDDSGLIRASSAQQLADSGLTAPGNTKIYPKSVSSLAAAHRLNDIASTAGTWTSLEAITVGDGKARVGSLVTLDGTALNPAYSGVWMASDIAHVMAGTPQTRKWTYTATIQLTRNQKNQAYFTSFSTLKDSLSEVPAVIRNGRWEASLMETIYV